MLCYVPLRISFQKKNHFTCFTTDGQIRVKAKASVFYALPSKDELMFQPPRATPSNPLFAKSVHSSPLLQFTRGFKSRRSPTSTSGTILGNVKKSAIPEIPPGTDIASFLKGYEAAKADPSCSTSQLSAAAKASAEASFTKVAYSLRR